MGNDQTEKAFEEKRLTLCDYFNKSKELFKMKETPRKINKAKKLSKNVKQ